MDENEDKMISMEEMLHYLTPRNKDENTDRGTSEIKNVVKNINALNDTGETQLDVAIKENNTKLIKILETMVEKRRTSCPTIRMMKSHQATI